jgi:hypothetical protein
LELTVLDGNKRLKQQVSGNNGKPFKVSALTDSSNSENVYYNTAICPSPDVGVRAHTCTRQWLSAISISRRWLWWLFQ